MREAILLTLILSVSIILTSCSEKTQNGDHSAGTSIDLEFTGVIQSEKLLSAFPKFAKVFNQHQPESSDVQFFSQLVFKTLISCFLFVF